MPASLPLLALLLTQPSTDGEPVDDGIAPVVDRDADVPVEVVAPEPEPEPEPMPEPEPTATPVAEPAPTPAAPYKPHKDPVQLETARYVPGKGFEVGTKDERFTLRLHGRVQLRYDIDHTNTGTANTHQTLQIRRARISLAGNVFSKYVHYYLQLGFSPRDQIAGVPNENGTIRRTPLRDARIEFDRLRDLTLWAGQMKVPFSRQRVVSSSSLNLVDRSIANDEFQLDRDIGVQLLSKDVAGKGWLAYNAGVFLGEGRNAYEPSDFGMLYVARVEVNPLGKRGGKLDGYSEGDLDRTEKPAMSIGGAYAFQDRSHYDRGTFGDPPADRGTTDAHNVTADLVLKWQGLSVQSAVHWRKTLNRKPGTAVDDAGDPIPLALGRGGVGWMAQVGYVVPKIPFEIVGRYGFVRNVIGESRSAVTWRDEAGGGVNYYFAGHWLKLQLDYFRLWGEEHGSSYASAAKHGNDRVRLQVQISF